MMRWKVTSLDIAAVHGSVPMVGGRLLGVGHVRCVACGRKITLFLWSPTRGALQQMT